jgi:hypothetical protein
MHPPTPLSTRYAHARGSSPIDIDIARTRPSFPSTYPSRLMRRAFSTSTSNKCSSFPTRRHLRVQLHPLLLHPRPHRRAGCASGVGVPIFLSVEARECEREGDRRQGATQVSPRTERARQRWLCKVAAPAPVPLAHEKQGDVGGVSAPSSARARKGREKTHTRAHHRRPEMRQARGRMIMVPRSQRPRSASAGPDRRVRVCTGTQGRRPWDWGESATRSGGGRVQP